MVCLAPRDPGESVGPRRLSGVVVRSLNFTVRVLTVNEPSPLWLLEPQWFFPFFALFWCAITALLAILGGWASLATYFRAAAPVEGERFRFVSGSMGARFLPVNYGNCLFVTVNETGFRLSILLLFRLLSPPLFIPWKVVTSVEPKRFLYFRYTVVKLRDQWPRISLAGKAGRQIEQAYASASGSTAP